MQGNDKPYIEKLKILYLDRNNHEKLKYTKNIKKEFPDMKILLEIKYTPNSMNLWDRIREELSRKKIAVSGSRFYCSFATIKSVAS